MLGLVPEYLLERFRRGQSQGVENGCAICVDLSGFTPLVERLSGLGRRGAEILSEGISSLYSRIEQAVREGGGFVSTFAGDSFSVVVPGGDSRRAGEMARILLELFGSADEITPGFGLRARVGVASGPIGWRVLGRAARRSYCFLGQPVRQASLAACSGAPGTVEDRGAFFESPFPPTSQPPPPPPSTGPEACFASRRVLGLGPGGEFRDVVPVFTGFRLGPGLGGLDALSDDAIGICCDYGGHVGGVFFEDKGPCLLTLFGAPIAHGNDLERACRFASDLAALHSGRTRSALSAGRGYAGLLGSRGRCTYTALGDVVNTACRVMCRAEWGSVMIAGRRGLRSAAGLQMVPRGLMRLKGKDRPVSVAAVEPLRAPSPTEHGAPLPQRGRWRELERMLAFISEGRHRAGPSVLLVTGGEGAGKTVFLQRLCGALGAGFSVFRSRPGRPGPGGDCVLAPLFGELGMRMGEADTDDDGPGGRSVLIDGPLSATVHAERAARLRQALRARAGDDLPVLVLDGLREADEASLCLLRALAATEGSLAVVASARNGGRTVPLRPQGAAAVLRIHLRPLGRRDASLLIRDVLDRPPDHALLESVLALSGGNPLFISEYCRLLLAEGALDPSSATARLLPGAAMESPENLGSVIAARLDRLEPNLRKLVLAASVLGREFSVGMLETVSGSRSISARLQAGQELGLWQSAGSGRFRFVHEVFRRRCYGVLMGRELRRLHAAAAGALESAGAAVGYRARELAHHRAMGGDVAGACRLLLESAVNAWQAGRFDEVADCIGRLSSLSPGQGKPEELLMRARALERCGRTEAAARCYSRLLEGDGDGARVSALVGLSGLLRRAGETAEALSRAQEALELCDGSEGFVLEALGAGRMAAGDSAGAVSAFEEQLAVAAPLDDRAVGRARAGLAAALEESGDIRGALREAEVAAALLEDCGQTAWAEACLARVGRLSAALGEHRSASNALEAWLRLALAAGRRRSECAARYALGSVLFESGDFREAGRQLRAAADLARTMGDRGCESRALGRLGSCLIRAGSRGRGMRALEAAGRIAGETSSPQDIAWTLTNMAAVHRSDGRLGEAAASLEQAVDLLGRSPDACGLPDVMITLADVRMRIGEGKEARRLLRRAMGLGDGLRQSAAMERARRRLMELERDRRAGNGLPDDASG